MYVKKAVLLVVCFCANLLFGEDLRLGSWNVRFVEKKDSLAGDAWSKRVPQISKIILFTDFDVIGIQEVDSAQTKDLNYFLDGYSYYAPYPQSGNAIFYKRQLFDVLDSGFFWVSETADSENQTTYARDHRTCVWQKMVRKGSNKIFYVFNSHWHHKIAEARNYSALQLLKKAPEIAGDYPWFYLGDLNAHRHQKALKTIENSGNAFFAMDSAKYVYAPEGSFNHYKYEKIGKNMIDHVIYNGVMSILRYGVLNMTYWDGEVMRMPSDHHPIFVQVDLK
ncbi:MAG: hypothetical protein GX638_01830 [Crenarchaeota archaeon]|nr:hypothetical protein [Thermoproteota archaeon]